MAMTPGTLKAVKFRGGEVTLQRQLDDHAAAWQDLIDTALEVVKAAYSPAALEASSMAAMDRLARLVGWGGPGPVGGPLEASQKTDGVPE